MCEIKSVPSFSGIVVLDIYTQNSSIVNNKVLAPWLKISHKFCKDFSEQKLMTSLRLGAETNTSFYRVEDSNDFSGLK